MNKNIKLKDMDVVVLCGGKGRRLQALSGGRPKPLIEINKQPFLDILLNYVSGFGFRRFILCTGYKASAIADYYKAKKYNFKIIFSAEDRLLGTAGAIKNARKLIKSNPFLVLNGDSFCALNFNEFVDFYYTKRPLSCVCLAKNEDIIADYGQVTIGKNQEIISFNEKANGRDGGFISAGIYLFSTDIFSMIPPNREFSLEYDLFPKIINKSFFGYETKAELIDIGTPARYKKATAILGGKIYA